MTSAEGRRRDAHRRARRLCAALLLGATLLAGCKPSSADNRSGTPNAAGGSGTGAGSVTTTGNAAGTIAVAPGSVAGAGTLASPSSAVAAVAATTTDSSNTMSLTVNGSLCGDPQYQYNNEPCVAVTICSPGTSTCQTISNLLLDTGSSGLRIFSSLVTIPTTPVAASNGTLAECVAYSGNSSDWGPLAYVDLKMGGEPAVRVPIQLINSTYARAPAQCSAPQTNPDTSPQEAGINGVLGVGLANLDCGTYCASTTANNEYYACTGSSCTPTATAVQVQNPVALLPVDNNGVILDLPAVPAGGAPSATGTVIFGIGTAANNTPTGVHTFAAASYMFSTVFAGTQMTSFIDSGSPLIIAPKIASLPDCTVAVGLFCPTSLTTVSATNIGSDGLTQEAVSFSVANGETLFNSNNRVFSTMVQDLTAGGSLGDFDWGLPFFLGRRIYNGIEAKKSPLGIGPYWAY